MSKFNDLTGKRFGKLLVVEKDTNKGETATYWICKCDCGNTKSIKGTNLTYSGVTSCGCNHRDDLVGQKFGLLTVIKRVNNAGASKWLCQCECGNTTVSKGYPLKSGQTKSCGCWIKDFFSKGNPKHNLYHTRIYKIWHSIKNRCNNVTHVAYKRYGGRGIKMCDLWSNDPMEFYNWAISNGYRDDLTIDRIDNDGNYCPENCRWTDAITQQNNTIRNVKYEYKGELLSMSQLARKYKINTSTLYHRLKKYNDIATAIELPLHKEKSIYYRNNKKNERIELSE